MKKLLFIFIMGITVVLAACGSDESGTEESGDQSSNGDTEQSQNEEQNKTEEDSVPAELSKALDDVITVTKELKSTAEESPDDMEKVNKQGNMLEENWDKIEKQVEEKDPGAYENIEKSLYPLKDEAKKDKPDVEKIKNLSEETINKVEEYKNKIQSK
ncbi:hypothetical protein BME96_14635 [Virgibacillus halodenitrificans]|uniref:Lipoprotein n=1 Tax=Virgibacillus halodenitrificans TaxID=1482 RepID=A0AAC9J0Z2_VIRHA|nr:hypothetical protein [Virgibacillus halodenitrificans]APC49351.1 hypothetical protein BME96_14635 [Virgibacillus halodenitrificans]